MLRRSWWTLAVLAALATVGTSSAPAQFNPSGSIQTKGWNMMFPLLNPQGCGGGGEAYMQRNWVAPHQIQLEDPGIGEEWSDIDFGNTAAATGFSLGNLNANPIWVTNEFLEGAFGLPAGAIPNGDVVDFQTIVDFINANVVPAVPGATPLASDNVVSLATTYVRNETGAPLLVDICSASDDSVQVWVNNVLTTNVSACRGTGDCSETRRALLPVGVSKIAVLVWEGGGGWGQRISLRLAGASSNLADGNGSITFLGPTGTTQVQYSTSRSAAIKPYSCPNDNVKVTVTGSGPGAPGDAVTVIETVEAGANGTLTIANVTNGGTVTETIVNRPEGTNAAGFVEDYLVIGPIINAGGAGPTDAVLQEVQIRSTSNAALDESSAAYQPKSGDTVPDNVLGIATTNCGQCGTINPGGVLTWNTRTALGNIDFNGNYYGGDVDNCMAAMGFYVCVETARDVYIGLDSDDSWTVRIDGVVRGFRSIPRGVTSATSIADFIGPINLSAGKHFVLFKVYEGGGGHGGHVGLFNADRTPITSGVSYSLDPTVPTCRSIVPDKIRKTITWETTRGAVSGGELMYNVSYNQNGVATITGNVVDEVVATGGVSSLAFGVQSGPLGIFDTSHDIGTPPTQGSTTFDGTKYTTIASGSDFWDGGDDGHFAYKAVTGDFVATMHVLNRVGPVAGGEWGKHGPMARYTCDRNSKHTLCETELATPGAPIYEPRHHHRINHLDNGSNRENYFVNDGVFPVEGRLPTWLRLVRVKGALTSYMSEDAGGRPKHWCVIGSDNDINRPATLLVGAALTSHAGGNTATIEYTFDIEPISDCVGLEALRLETGATRTDGLGSVPYEALLVTAQIVPDAPTAVAAGGSGLGVKNRNWFWTDLTVGSENLAGTKQLLWNNENRNFNPDGAGVPAVTPLLSFSFNQAARVYIAWDSRHVKGGSENPTGAVDNGWFDFNNDVGTVNAQGWLRLSESSVVNPGADVIAASGDDNFAHGGVWAKDVAPGDSIETYQTGFGGGQSPYVLFVRCGQTCIQGDVLATRDYDEAGDVGVVVAGGTTPASPPIGAVDGKLRLTVNDIGNQRVGVWYGVAADPAAGGVPLATQGFVAEFDAFMVKPAPITDPADGMTFAVISTGQNDGLASAVAPFPTGLDIATLRGSGGGTLAFGSDDNNFSIQQRSECHSSFAIEMDNWVGVNDRSLPANEPADGGSPDFDGNWHIGVDVQMNVSSVQTNANFGVPSPSLPDIFNAQGVHVEVMYQPDGSINVWVSGLDKAGNPVPRTQVLGTKISALPAGDLVMGFTAATGGATCEMSVDNFQLSSLCCELSDVVSIAGDTEGTVGSPTVLTASVSGAELGSTVTYNWEVVSGSATLGPNGGSSISVTPTAAGPVTVRVSTNDGLCGGASAEHTIEAAEICDLTLNCSAEAGQITVRFTGAPASCGCAELVVRANGAEVFRGAPPANGMVTFPCPGPSASIEAQCSGGPVAACEVSCGTPFVRGDCNQDGEACRQVSDMVRMIQIGILGVPAGSCPAACDANGDGEAVNSVPNTLADVTYLANFCFLGTGAAPPAPYPSCGVSPNSAEVCLPPTFCAP